MAKNNILETCLHTLLDNHPNRFIFFPLNDTLQLMDLPDSYIRKKPIKRYVQCIRINNTGQILVDIITPSAKEKAKISSYYIHNFDETTKGLILNLAIKYQNS